MSRTEQQPQAGNVLVITAFLTAGCGVETGATLEPTGTHSHAIIAGQLAADLPAVGALVTAVEGDVRAFCSATLIGPLLALTAAHCLARVPPQTPIGLYLGNDLANEPRPKLHPISKRVPHPLYRGGTLPDTLGEPFDIGVVRLAAEVAGNAAARLLRPDQVGESLRVGQPVVVAGFGVNGLGEPLSSGVRRRGNAVIGEVATAELWINSADGAQKCVGDSGGPTFVDRDPTRAQNLWLVGVASRAGDGCTRGSAETRVDRYLDWLHRQGALACDSGLSEPCPAPPTISDACGCSSPRCTAQQLWTCQAPLSATQQAQADASAAPPVAPEARGCALRQDSALRSSRPLALFLLGLPGLLALLSAIGRRRRRR